eukprot:TRINITY_DN1354_c1_g2_i1.p1 TRINITY_DN1354_c1_g2~~TRINITY_DN1354_c1_g2_i1.p1  ORF type:complete len:688 (-),score=195.98 TRINITY_DN1354_c1_g2_i1:817-2715(-)
MYFPIWDDQTVANEQFDFDEKFFSTMLDLTPKQQSRFATYARPEQYLRLKGNAKPVLFAGFGISGYSVKQSIIGDCSFLASLTVAANYERENLDANLISKCFYPRDSFSNEPIYNPSGKYVFRLFKNGMPRKVVVDDLMPVDSNNRLLCSSSSNSTELWVSLLEKAYMTVMYGKYHEGGLGYIDMHTLFGWIPECIYLRKMEQSTTSMDVLFARLFSMHENGDCMLTLSTSSDNSGLTENLNQNTGLLSNHAYAVLDIKLVDGIRLIRVKNPWGHERWRGDYSPSDTNNWTHSLLQKLDYDVEMERQVDNGVFWMDWYSVCTNFERISLALNPKSFEHHRVTHGSIQASREDEFELMSDSGSGLQRTMSFENSSESRTFTINGRAYGAFPQYALRVNAKKYGSIKIMLIRHKNQDDGDVWQDSEEDFMAIDVYENYGGTFDNKGWPVAKRIDRPTKNDLILDGQYRQEDMFTYSMDIEPGKSCFTIVVCHSRYASEFNYTLRVFSKASFALKPIKSIAESIHDGMTVTVDGKWDETNAGGCRNFASYKVNPMFKWTVNRFDDGSQPCPIHIRLEGLSRLSMGMSIIKAHDRVSTLQNVHQNRIKDSGSYLYGVTNMDLYDIQSGTVQLGVRV